MKTKNQKSKRIKKTILMLCLSLTIPVSVIAQDKITFLNGDELFVKVLEINETNVKYKKANEVEAPMHTISKSTIFSIVYLNGSKDIFWTQNSIKNTEEKSENLYITAKEHPLNNSQVVIDSNEFLPKPHKKFGGPRIGMTYITSGTSSDYISDKGKNPLITQFGWQFEQRLFTIENGTSGIIEFVPLIGGMEQGLFLPSANLLIGMRSGGKRSFEFALGPNVSLSGLGMVFAAGTNFKSGKVNFPVNLALVPSVGSSQTVYDNTGIASKQHVETGWRISLTVGFNSRKK